MPSEDPEAPRRGRAREAAHNDAVIYESAKRVLARDPRASVATVARAAGVGKSAMYLRFPSKEIMLQRVAEHMTARFTELIDEAIDGLDAGNDARSILMEFLERCVDADLHAFIGAINGLFTPSDDDVRASRLGYIRGVALVEALRGHGALHADVTWTDLNDWLVAISSISSFDPNRVMMRRHRMLSVLLPGLEPRPEPLTGESAVPGDYWPADIPGFAARTDVT